MGRKITGTIGTATVEIGGELQDTLLRVLNGSSRRVLQTMIAYDEKIVDDAKKEWPVVTGRSRDGFRITTKIEQGRSVVVGITNDARNPKERNPRYARYPFYTRIPIKKGAGGSYWSVLLAKPWRRGIKQLIKELSDDLLESSKAA
jgi:hypothetical protein